MKGVTVFRALACAVLSISSSAVFAGPVNGPWIWQRPLITGDQLNAIAEASPGGQLLIVGNSGVVLKSPNGSTWTSVRTLYSDYTQNSVLDGTDLTALTYWNGMFIAGGDSQILTSTDGSHWSAGTVDDIDDTSLSISAFAVAGSHIVATGGAGGDSLYVSGDGKAWKLVTDFDFRPNGAAHALNGKFYVTVWNPISIETQLEVSTDGTSWSHDTSYPTADATVIACSGSLLLAMEPLGNVYSTSDGTTWSAALPTPADTGFLQWTGREFVLLSEVSPSYYTSADGTSWTLHALPTDGVTVTAISHVTQLLWTGSQYVVIGSAGAIYTSPDGDNWTAVSTPGTESFNTVFWDGSKFLIYGQRGEQFSGDGTSWTMTTLTGTNASFITTVSKGDQAYLSSGVAGGIQVSTDGLAWNSATGLTQIYSGFAQCGNIATAMSTSAGGASIWAASADVSSGFLTWTEKQTTFSGPPVGMACGNGVFVANFQSSIATSTDGLNWKATQLSNTAVFNALTFQNGAFILLGQNGEVYTSSDAINWTHVEPISTEAPPQLTQLVWDGKEYIGTNTGAFGLWTSPDLTTWYEDVNIAGLTPLSLAAGGGHALVVSFDGAIAESTAGAGTAPALPPVNITAPYVALSSTSGQCQGSDPGGQTLVYELTEQDLSPMPRTFNIDSFTGAFTATELTFTRGVPITFLCRVSNGLMIATSLVTINAVTPPPSGGSGGGTPAAPQGGGGGGSLGWLSLLILFGASILKKINQTARDRKNVFESLINAVRFVSLGQNSHALDRPCVWRMDHEGVSE